MKTSRQPLGILLTVTEGTHALRPLQSWGLGLSHQTSIPGQGRHPHTAEGNLHKGSGQESAPNIQLLCAQNDREVISSLYFLCSQ